MKAIDLHVHSTKSDGSYTPTELVNYALEKGLSAFALTDHDTTDGITEALAAAKGKNIEVIPGIEFSSEYEGRDIHIVGLYIDYESDYFKRRLVHFVNGRKIRNVEMCTRLTEHGMPVTYEELEAEFNILLQQPDSAVKNAERFGSIAHALPVISDNMLLYRIWLPFATEFSDLPALTLSRFAYSAQSDGVVFFEEFRKVAAGLDRTRNVDLISTTEAARRKLEDILIRETDGELDQMTSEVAATSLDECVRMEHIDLVKENRGLSERAETRESQVIQLLARDHVNKLRWMRLLLLAARYWWLLGFGILFAVASAISDSVILRGFSTVPILIQLGQFAADKFVDDRGLRFRVYDKALAYVKCRYANKISAKVEAAGYASDKDAVVDYCVAHTPVFDRLKR